MDEDYCYTCKVLGKVEEHHLNYEKNITIKVCKYCHEKIHHTDEWPNLKPVDSGKQTIQVEDTTLEKIKAVKLTKRESYDEVINRLLDNQK